MVVCHQPARVSRHILSHPAGMLYPVSMSDGAFQHTGESSGAMHVLRE
jgi:hypothetical protein